MTLRIALLCRGTPGAVDAIRARAEGMAEALELLGHRADVHLRLPDGDWCAGTDRRRRLSTGLEGYDAVLLEYNPFLYGRRGFAPWLPLELVAARRRPGAPRLILAVHEPFVMRGGVAQRAMGAWQRAQLFGLRAAADVVLVSIEAWAEALGRWWPSRPTRHLPSGSTVPDARSRRNETRARLGFADDELVFATLSSGHPSHVDDLVHRAIARVAERRSVALLALGARPAPAWRVDGARLVSPGAVPPAELAAGLASADLFLAPLSDGVSSRRTSLAAALQHGLSVVGTRGPLTDSALVRAADALALAPIGDPEAFVELAERLAGDAAERAERGRAARRLYEERYAAPVLARIVVEACGA